MDLHEFKQHLKSHDAYIVDIREPSEFEELPPIPGIQLIPMKQFLELAMRKELDPNKLIITVCRSGGRCLVVNEQLARLGYKVDLLEGGTIAWHTQENSSDDTEASSQ